MKILVPLLTLALTACGTVLHVNGEDAQGLVDQRVLGMSVGDFFDRYGAPRTRAEAPDGTRSFGWESGFANVAAGPQGAEERSCVLQLTSAKNGRITAAKITSDAPGERHLSRCADLFG